MSNHQFSLGELVEYVGSKEAYVDSIATVLEQNDDNTYMIRFKVDNVEETVPAESLESLD